MQSNLLDSIQSVSFCLFQNCDRFMNVPECVSVAHVYKTAKDN